jgi:hypothetical protein
MSNEKTITKPLKSKNVQSEMTPGYTADPYFLEKDRKAVEFLKKHPIPAKFLK